jgi:AraC-like DNA-binding protein
MGGKSPLVIFVLKGHLHIEIEESNYIAKAGQIILIDCNKSHTYYCDKYCDFIFMHFSGNNSMEITNHLIYQNHGPLFDSDEVLTLFNELDTLITLIDHKRIISEVALSQVVYKCICILQSSNEVFTTRSSDVTKIITQAIYYIKNHITEMIRLSDLAEHVNMSSYYFAHIFKNEMKIPPIEYIAQMKINYSKTQLTTTNSSIQEISDYLGYSSCSSFINAFRSRVGISPKRYRIQETSSEHTT